MVDEFRSRKLDAEYPVIWVDKLYENLFLRIFSVTKNGMYPPCRILGTER